MHIKVGPIEYEKVMVPDLRDSYDTKLYGQVAWTECEIKIKPGQNPQQERLTDWHEIVHIVFDQLGCNEDINNEPFVSALSCAMMQVVLDNPWLAEEPR